MLTLNSTTQEQVLITIDNMVLSGVTYAIIDSNPSNIILEGGSLTIVSWVLGTVYDPGNPDGSWFTGQPFDSPHLINGSLYSTLATIGQAGYFERTKPAYLNTTRDYWLSASLLATGTYCHITVNEFLLDLFYTYWV